MEVAGGGCQSEKLHPWAPKPTVTAESSRKSFLRCLRPLHWLSNLFGLWPFLTLRPEPQPLSPWCVTYSLLVMVVYSVFHLYINYTDRFGAGTDSTVESNFVSVVIDIYNRYSGLILFWLLHTVALATRRTLAAILSGVMAVDEQIAQRLAVTPDHSGWCRFICLHVALMFLAIGLSERFNCIMYMSDFIPASEYCIFQCFTTMLTSSTVETQYMAFVAVIKSRLRLINELLVQLNAYGADQERAHYEQFLLEARPSVFERRDEKRNWPLGAAERRSNRVLPYFLLDEIAPYARSTRARTAAVDVTSGAKPPNSQAPQAESIPRGDRPRWQKIKRLQHKIITVNQAPPSERSEPKPGHPPAVTGGPTQFPLLVASLMHSQTHQGACEHIRMKIINDIKNVYTHLHLLSLNINKAYGAQLIFILMTLFVTLTTLLYYCTMKLFRMLWLGQREAFGDLITTTFAVLSTLSWAFISTFRMLRICSVCNSAKNEAQKIGSLIHGLGWKTNCRTTKAMVRMLSLQLQQQRIEFTAGGLFAIDHGLMFNIVGSLATYLLILIQFDIAQNGAKWKSDPTGLTDGKGGP